MYVNVRDRGRRKESQTQLRCNALFANVCLFGLLESATNEKWFLRSDKGSSIFSEGSV